MRTFLQLLPYRIEQMIGWKVLRASRTRYQRSVSAPRGLSVVPAVKPRIFVDMTIISRHDAGTGIQRLVRTLALALLAEKPDRWDIRFVAAGQKNGYCEIEWPVRPGNSSDQKELVGRPGDVFLGLDYSLDAVRQHRRQLAQFRQEGGRLWFLIHDLLPLNNPEWFSCNTVIRYGAWLGAMAAMADGFLCNSPQTEAELKDALSRLYGVSQGYSTQILPLGHAILDAPKSVDVLPCTPRFDLASPFALMVGTLEPRKGHQDVLSAFEMLWRDGWPTRLVLVGRRGWKVGDLHTRITSHSEYGKRLLWFDDVGDTELSEIYQAATGVIIASHGEGFGLPLIEALGVRKPVLARDLSVFRNHEGKGVTFFPAQASAHECAQVITKWFDAAREGRIVVIPPADDWHKSVKCMLAALK